MDEPFFNFDSEEMDDEELYSESLLEELKKQQVCVAGVILTRSISKYKYLT